MKKTLHFTILTCLMLMFAQPKLNAQCRLLSDSSLSETADYIYNLSDQLVKIEFTSSGFPAGFDTVLYDGAGAFDSLLIFFGSSDTVPSEIIGYTRDGSGLITRVHAEANAQDTFTVAYDLIYNGGQITDILLDTSSLTGSSEPAFDFRNIVWTNNNATNFDLVGDFGFGLDTIELTATYDDKINVESKFPPEYDDLLFFFNGNNILEATFDNDEALGVAGTVALAQSYSYNMNSEVDTLSVDSNIFDPEKEVIIYTYDCPVGIEKYIYVNDDIVLYPNPFNNSFSINNVLNTNQFRLRLINIEGRIVHDQMYLGNKTTVNVGDLPIGIYIAEIISDQKTERKKLIKR